ncbi:MAG: hypothetical protein R3A12_05720 [Ignavibacteria bacterium]
MSFRQEPEAIWLPETACNTDTLEILAEENIKYIILDPSQAEKIRKIGNIRWTDVSSGNINTNQPYVYYSKIYSGKSINIFFYDGPLSKNIAFDDHIFDSARLMNRLKQIPINNKDNNNLVSVGVDGETFGHHKKYTERTLSYLFSEMIPESEFTIVNFGEYLSLHPPVYEVKIKEGHNGEGTSELCTRSRQMERKLRLRQIGRISESGMEKTSLGKSGLVKR